MGPLLAMILWRVIDLCKKKMIRDVFHFLVQARYHYYPSIQLGLILQEKNAISLMFS